MQLTNDATAIVQARRRPGGRRAEAAIAGVLLALALIGFVPFAVRLHTPVAKMAAALCLAVLLAGGYVVATVRSVVRQLAVLVARSSARTDGMAMTRRALPGPMILFAAALLYSVVTGGPALSRAGIYAAALFLPALALVLLRRFDGAGPLAAAALFWLPLEFHLLPALPLPAVRGGWDATYLLELVNALYLFLVARPIPRVGLTFVLKRGDFARALLAFAAFAALALPIGLGTGFLRWDPRLTVESLLGAPLAIYLGTAVPEEFLFRGVIQNVCSRRLGPRGGLAVASCLFGLAHLPDWRYAVLATVAGVAYGWVYARQRKVTASAITHASVDWVWILLLRR